MMTDKPEYTLEVDDDGVVYTRGPNSGSTLSGATAKHIARRTGAAWLGLEHGEELFAGGDFTPVSDSAPEHQHDEWQCDYCGRPNQRHDETCKSCGAVRSFIYA